MEGDRLSKRAGEDARKWSWGLSGGCSCVCAVRREGEGRGHGGGEWSVGFERRRGACAVGVGILLGEVRGISRCFHFLSSMGVAWRFIPVYLCSYRCARPELALASSARGNACRGRLIYRSRR